MKIFSLITVFFGYMLASSSSWVIRKFGQITYEQLVFHSNIPLDTDIRLIKSFFQNTVMISVIITFVCYFIFKKISPKKSMLISLAFFLSTICWTYDKLNIKDLFFQRQNHHQFGNFYETKYQDPHNIEIKSPKQKRNLILIFAESIEASYANQKQLGDNYIPELVKLAEDNINFSNSDGLGGFYNLNSTRYTQASLIAQFCAIPLRLPIDSSRFRPKNGFLPDAVCLYDILSKDDYELTFMYGTLKESSGTDKFFASHGNPKILDWNFYSKRDNLQENKTERKKGNYSSFFKKALRDQALFKYAKDELTSLSKKDKPFAFTMMTLDSHFGTEYFDHNNCELKYHDDDVPDKYNYKNVVSCVSYKLNNFVNWIKEQPFYDNTEIVIVGDHLVMGEAVPFPSGADRKIYNVYINSSIKDGVKQKNRHFTALDTMPTILEGMGYQIAGHKLGLGVSLFSGEKTLLEEGITLEELNTQLDKQSKVYNKILYGKDFK